MSLKNRFLGIGPVILAMAMFLAVDTASRAQSEPGASPPPAPSPGHVHGGVGRGLGMQEMRFLEFQEGLGGKTVTGAPFSASFSTQNSIIWLMYLLIMSRRRIPEVIHIGTNHKRIMRYLKQRTRS